MPSRATRWFAYLTFALIGCAVLWGIYAKTRPIDEVVLTLGETYENVRKQSRSTLPPAAPEIFWGGFVTRPAKLRFTAHGYGFVTPPAKFLYVGTDKFGKVESVTLSPQVQTLPLNASMAILMDLQNQFRQGGWKPFHSHDNRPIEDTEATRNAIRTCTAPTARWQADDKYQVSLNIRCFRMDDQPNDERYLITLDLGPPVFDDDPND